MWIFGYGSLIWKVDFQYECKIIGYVKGYLRRFYQHSVDHRGTPEKLKPNKRHRNHDQSVHEPGRVVTLIPSEDENSTVWGVAYKIRNEDINHVSNHLDYREKNGYSKICVMFHPIDNLNPFPLTLYVATSDNESYAGAASIEEIAKQVISCSGPSGTNKEYVYRLAEAMRKLHPNIKDSHLYDLEAAVKRLDPD